MNKRNNGLALVALTLWSSTGLAQQDSDWEWSGTLERISSGIVAIQVDATRAFDTEWNLSSQATGFVVDAERGLILTNRHVVTPGPVVAQAVFLNREEVELKPVYRDPVHDFGFFSFDPEALRFIEPVELSLFPDGAEIGREIRVVGNDAGEQLSILSGTLARLDRRAPEYGVGKYNDFNTFYYQAASGTSGGSSGSPVIDIQGRVIALNAGANSGAASSFFLPLDRVERALKLIQADQPVSRGTLQTMFVHSHYDELARLGLRPETEAEARTAFPEQTGMLVAAQVVPGSPAESVIDPGDVLIRVNNELMTEFSPLAEVLDDSVGEEIEIELQRGGITLTQRIVVEDLHEITPDEYLEFGEAVVHDLSYQQARHFNMPVVGIYVANPGYVFGASAVPRGAVITEFDGRPVPRLEDFEAVLAELAEGQRATVRYYTYDDPSTTTLRVVSMDRRWFPSQKCHRDDALGYWPCVSLSEPVTQVVYKPASAEILENGDPRVERLAPSLVTVHFDMPYTVSGVSERNYYGTGVIADAERGYVVVDRNTVPVAMGDVKFTFGGSLEIPGRVEYIHPLHNLALVSYDPTLVGDTPVRSARFSTRPVKAGDKLWIVGLRPDQTLLSQSTEVSSVDPAYFPLSRTLRFRDTNLETISVVSAPENVDGVLADQRGDVVALWSSFAYQSGRDLHQESKGMAADLVEEMLELVSEGRELRSLEVEFALIPLSSARKFGLSEQWIKVLQRHDTERRQVLSVERLVAGTPAAAKLVTGDLFLAVDGQPVSRFREVERAVQKDQVQITIWRNGEERQIDLATVALDGRDVDRVVLWAGALLQAPHRAMAAQRGIPPVGVYVAFFAYGSPANRYGLWAGRRIMEVDGLPTPDLDAFIEVVSGREDRDSVRLKTINWNNAVEVITLKLDSRYWPSYELKRNGGGWERIALNQSS